MSILNSSYDNRIKITGICAVLLVGLALIGFVIDVRWDMRHIQEISLILHLVSLILVMILAHI